MDYYKERVWKGIFRIPDLTKIRCGNLEKDKYIDGTQDLTVQKLGTGCGTYVACLSGKPEAVTTHQFLQPK